MSLEYYLLCKKKYDAIIRHLEEIMDNYDDIFSCTSTLDVDTSEHMVQLFNPTACKEQINTTLLYTSHLKSVCEQQIQKLCTHEFVNDVIDINPERSQSITYCNVCEYTIEK